MAAHGSSLLCNPLQGGQETNNTTLLWIRIMATADLVLTHKIMLHAMPGLNAKQVGPRFSLDAM